MADPSVTMSLSGGTSRYHVIQLYSPLLLVVSFAISSIYVIWKDQKSSRIQRSKSWSNSIILLNFAITVSFVAQALNYLRNPIAALESGFIHDLCQILLWTTLFLSTVTASIPTEIAAFLPTWSISLLIEGIIIFLEAGLFHTSQGVYVPRVVLQAVTIALHLMLIVTGLALNWRQPESGSAEESQSLLGNDNDSTTKATYSTKMTGDDASTTDASDEDSDDDEKELKAQRKKKIENEGLIAYFKPFKIFLPYVLPYQSLRMRVYMAVIIFNTLILRGLNVYNPYQLSVVIDRLTSTGEIAWKNVILWIVSGLLSGNGTGLATLNQVLSERLSAWSRQQMYVTAFDRVMSLSMSFHDQKDSGEVIKALEQAGSLNSLFNLLIIDLVPCCLDVVIALGYIAFLFDIYASLILVALGIAFYFSTKYMTQLMTKVRRVMTAKDRDQSKVLFESVSNWATVSYFNRKSHEVSRLSTAVNNARLANIKNYDVTTCLWGVEELVESIGRFSIALLAIYRTSIGTSTVGKFVALQSYWSTIMFPLYILGHSLRELTTCLVDAERLLQIFETPIAVKDKELALPIQVTRGEVEVTNMDFAYEGLKTTLEDLSFKAKPGQTIAFVGETGSGKSTTLKLLMRFYDVTGGSIKLDGQDIRDVTIDSLRDVFGFVPQDTVLFNTTIMENVRYGRLDATDEEVHEACREACIHDKILTFPGGYRSLVGERGVKLSGGERQRIAIARVILKKPKVVLLDEATSAMDSLTETKIQTALNRLMKGQTAFVIAHRLSTVANADLILVLENGKIVQSGTHSELLHREGRYAELCKKQELAGDPKSREDEDEDKAT